MGADGFRESLIVFGFISYSIILFTEINRNNIEFLLTQIFVFCYNRLNFLSLLLNISSFVFHCFLCVDSHLTNSLLLKADLFSSLFRSRKIMYQMCREIQSRIVKHQIISSTNTIISYVIRSKNSIGRFRGDGL